MPACDLRRLPAFRLCPSNLNLPTLVGVAFSASLSRRPPTRAGEQPFELCLRSSTSGLHRLPRLSSLTLPPACDLRRLPTLRLCLSTSTSGLHRLPRSLAFAFPACLRLAPGADSHALPRNLNLRLSSSNRFSGAPSRPALRLSSALWPFRRCHHRTDLRLSADCSALRFGSPADPRLAPPANLAALPSDLCRRLTASSSVEKNFRTGQPVHATANPKISVQK
jgi:hypothetical protein